MRGFAGAALGLALPMAIPDSATAQLRLAPVISDGMVMQRHATVPVWGRADRGDTVVVRFDGHTYRALSDAHGQWVVKLPPRAAGGPYELTVASAREQLHVRNILIGDVWFCAGQSNMVMEVNRSRNAAQEIAVARDLQIRHFRVPIPYDKKPAIEPAAEIPGGAWTIADSAHVGDFTAVGYFFARELRKSIDVPIGLVNVSVGGSAIEHWMRREILSLDADSVAKLVQEPPFRDLGPTLLYNKQVHPLRSYPIKGILWYQGEATSWRDFFKYREQFASMIQDWRQAWELGNLPFLFVQLPQETWRADTVPPSSLRQAAWAVLRESQSTALRLPNTAQVVTIDLRMAPGEKDPIHPSNKQDVGARLALAARKVAYGEKVEYSGPRYRRQTIRDGRVILEFDHVGRGLVAGREEGELQGFAIAGADRQFVWAHAKIDQDRVIVWNERVLKPMAVRYAWSNNPDRATLYNGEGLPAVPFRTDEWAE